MCHEVVDMAQRVRESVFVRISRRLRSMRHRGAFVALCVLLVAAVAGLAVAGTTLASGESFTIERSQRAEEAVDPGKTGGASGDKLVGETVSDAAESDDMVIVDVDGAVTAPGVYELEQGARVADAIAAAGGLSPDADTTSLNQAAEVADGSKIYVPVIGSAPAAGSSSGDGSTGSAAANGSQAGASSNALVNINAATLEELDGLPGIGPATAQAIIDDRTENGPFTSPEDLMRVSGIGEKKFEKLSSLICI